MKLNFKSLSWFNRLKSNRKEITNDLARLKSIDAFMVSHAPLFAQLETGGNYIAVNYGRWATSNIDIHDPSRDTVKTVMRYFAAIERGTWEKDYYEDKVNYLRKITFGKGKIGVRLYHSPPPEFCKVVVDKTWVEPTLVPGHWEEKRSLKCSPGVKE
jgi:hypothetical protein